MRDRRPPPSPGIPRSFHSRPFRWSERGEPAAPQPLWIPACAGMTEGVGRDDEVRGRMTWRGGGDEVVGNGAYPARSRLLTLKRRG